jgi:hypothetical protein
MVRDAEVSTMVDYNLKERLELEADKAGLSLAKYVEQLLDVHSQPPRLELREPQVVHAPRFGTHIKLNLAVGWPSVLLPLEQAEKLVKDLHQAVVAGKKLQT